VLQQSAFSRTRGTQNGKHLAPAHLKVNPLQHRALRVTHRQVARFNHDFGLNGHRRRLYVTAAEIASATMISKMLLTTDRVVDSPTARGPSPVCSPRKQLTEATMPPKTMLLESPSARSPKCKPSCTWLSTIRNGKPKPSSTGIPPSSPAYIAYMVSTGANSKPATTRWTTRNCTGDRPIVCRALSSSFTFIVPSSAA